jgi:signal transduction histidine kinase
METSFNKELFVSEKYINQMYMTTDMISSQKTFIKTYGKNISNEIAAISGMSVFLYDMDGNLIASNIDDDKIFDLNKMLSYAKDDKAAYFKKDGQVFFISPIHGVKENICILILNKSMDKEIGLYNNIKSSMIYICFGIAITLLTISIIYFTRYANKIMKLNKHTKMIVNGIYNIDIFKSRDELGELSREIRNMALQIQSNIIDINNEKNSLKITNNKLKELENKQKQFFSNVTHEFKTPLTGIKAYSDLLEMYDDDPELLKDGISSIKKEASRLQTMIEKVLKLQEIERYDFELFYEELNLKELIEDIVIRMNGKAEKNDIAIICDLQPCTIFGDKEAVIQIFINIIDNAIKYNNPQGKVFITSDIKDNVRIEVRDTGIGIEQEDRAKVFEPFYTAAKDRSRETGGNGLGLSIVKQLVEKQKGLIFLGDSSNGCTFVITFPSVK